MVLIMSSLSGHVYQKLSKMHHKSKSWKFFQNLQFRVRHICYVIFQKLLLFVMNVFIVTFIYYCTLFHIIVTSIELNPPKFNSEKWPKSKLYMEEELIPFYKQRKVELILNEHNKYRDLHGVPKLELDRNITYEAEIWAELLTSFENPKIDHYINYGENIWIKKTKDIESFMNVDDLNPVRAWYNQIVNYTGPHSFAENSRSFTQLVWKSSRKLGVGFAYSALVLYVVCYYDPPGNAGHLKKKHFKTMLFRENVLQPKNSTVEWFDEPDSATKLVVIAVIFSTVFFMLLILYCTYYDSL